MKKKLQIVALAWLMSISANAQIYPGDSWAQFPTRNLYDTGITNMYLRALAETAERRERNFNHFSDLAIEAFENKQWNYVVYYVNEALDTHYYNGNLFYLRGYAYVQMNNLRAAKKDYKKGIKYGCSEAAEALGELKAKKEQQLTRITKNEKGYHHANCNNIRNGSTLSELQCRKFLKIHRHLW